MSDIAKFTPGPWAARPDENSSCEWEVVKNDPRKTSISQDPWFICLCMDDADGASAEDNARLIAAAPELYEALDRLAKSTQKYRAFGNLIGVIDEQNKAYWAALSALAKARGEA